MSGARFLLRRFLWTLFALWLVFSGTFFLFAYTPDPNVDVVAWAAGASAAVSGENATAAAREAAEAYIRARNYDEPVLDRYLLWMRNYATLQWGYSFSQGKPVVAVFAERGPVTLTYLVPSMLLSTLGGMGFGIYAALRQHSLVDRIGTSLSYAGVGVPIIYFGPALGALAFEYFGVTGMSIDRRYSLWAVQNLDVMALITVVMTAQLLAVQVRHTRAEALEYVAADFVKTFRAGGARARDVARHVLRNASLTLVSLFFSESLTVLFVSIYVVEVVFSLPGLGQAAFVAIESRDIGLILATTLLPVVVGVVGNFVQDVLYVALDPRVGEED